MCLAKREVRVKADEEREKKNKYASRSLFLGSGITSGVASNKVYSEQSVVKVKGLHPYPNLVPGHYDIIQTLTRK